MKQVHVSCWQVLGLGRVTVDLVTRSERSRKKTPTVEGTVKIYLACAPNNDKDTVIHFLVHIINVVL